ncbi:hypothetical protein [Spirilliplanes yamanashiensis]|uniref:Uncharacterized protein n=1 Tax=Spirilliplanes yamanashiensis TaxID=42233 RepID=A0A8J3Y6P7_9ACTN|nr:hypothetical protein [Spirilliplanes yamanashiensis]MDP9815138.1 hypothetical protein [Spirilliplanes yamanashiensis]GIJ02793.1 hypothetical protein Sya03_21450 [Spirilliplanes yamanashiensis]
MTDAEPASPLYPVVGDDPDLAGLSLPRRRAFGAIGVLLVDRPAATVWLLDADDETGVFRLRERRPLEGDPADLDPPPAPRHSAVRAAMEGFYDVTAAPWVGERR